MTSRALRLLALVLSLPLAVGAQTRIPIESGTAIAPVNVTAQSVTYKGRQALRVEPRAVADDNAQTIAVLPHEFSHGTIEVDVAGAPSATADTSARGFVGIAFHVQPDTQRLQTFYLRPTNGRARDQLRRNHATQYTSEPEWPWYRLRRELPGVYESYVDLVTGEWTKLRIVVGPRTAELYVNGSAQPVLVINDLKSAFHDGKLALWVGAGTVAHFANLRVTPDRAASGGGR